MDIKNTPDNIFNISDKHNFVRTYVSNFDRKMVSKTDLIQGIYNIYSSMVPQGKYSCADPECKDDLLLLEARIVAAVEKDGTLYLLRSLQPELASILVETNRKVLMCMQHLAVSSFIEVKDEPTGIADVIPISRAISPKNKFKPKPRPPFRKK